MDPDEAARQWLSKQMELQGVKMHTQSLCGDFLESPDHGVSGKNELWIIDQEALSTEALTERLMEKKAALGSNIQILLAYHHLSKTTEQFDHLIPKPFMIDHLIEQVQAMGLASRNEPSTNTEEIPNQEKEIKPMGLKILVVEDHPINAKLARIYLEKLGCVAEFVQSGVQALKCVERRDFDVILMDIHMPLMDGFETTRKLILQSEGKLVPQIIAVTAGVSEKERKQAYEVGMVDFLPKPLRFDRLHEALTHVKRTSISPVA